MQLQQLVGAPAAIQLHPRETGDHEQQQRDEDLGRAPQLRRLPRHLDRDPHARTLARCTRPLRGRCGKHVARRRGALRQAFCRRRGRKIGIGLDDRELQRRPVHAEADDVAALEQRVAGDPLPVHECSVAAAEILQHEAFGLAHDGGVARRDIEVTLGIESHIGERVTAEPDVTLAEGFDLSRPGTGKKLELGFH